MSLAVGAVGGPLHPCSAKGGGGMYRFQPGQRAQKAEDQGQEHTGWSMTYFTLEKIVAYIEWGIIDPSEPSSNFRVDAYEIIIGRSPYGRV